MLQMLGETSIFTLPGKVQLSQKYQNGVLCVNMNKHNFSYILELKFFFKNNCSTMIAGILIVLLLANSEMINLCREVCLIIIHRNTSHFLDISCCHKHQQQKKSKLKYENMYVHALYVCLYTFSSNKSYSNYV